jgi:endonuclease III
MVASDIKKAARVVCRYLAAEYPASRLGNPRNPLDDLIFIILSNRTTPSLARQAFGRLKAKGRWSAIAALSTSETASLIQSAGLSRKKARWIHDILAHLDNRFGRPTLSPLRRLSPSHQLAFLCALPGVSVKVAKCVMMYTLDAKVLPVDVHVHRLSTRMGWISARRADAPGSALESFIAPSSRFSFHVNAIQHGRAVCRSAQPLCMDCCLSSICPRVGVRDARIEEEA